MNSAKVMAVSSTRFLRYRKEKWNICVIYLWIPGWTNRTSRILSTWLLYAVIWKTHSGESWMHVIFTGTKSSDTCCHFTVPAPLALTWNTSAHNLKALIAELRVAIRKYARVRWLGIRPRARVCFRSMHTFDDETSDASHANASLIASDSTDD